MLHVTPILKTLWRSKLGPLLIILQLGLTIAIVGNALFFIDSRLQHIARPSGVADEELARLWVKEASSQVDIAPVVARDIAHLSALPGVQGVSAVGSVPFSHAGSSSGLHNYPEGAVANDRVQVSAAVMESDHRAVEVLGLTLIAGRSFRPEEIVFFTRADMPAGANAIITRSVAEQAFPNSLAVGKTLYLAGEIPLQIVGVVENFLGYFPDSDFASNNVLVSVIEQTGRVNYVMRADRRELRRTVSDAAEALRELDSSRMVSNESTLSELIQNHYHSDYAMITLLLVVMALLILVNTLGIVGVTTFWVNQRRRQIGIRRALGATRSAIVGLFLVESAVLSLVAALLGGVLAFWGSAYAAQRFGFEFVPWHYVLSAALAVALVCQLAAAIPARRAAQIPPREALAQA